MKKFFIVLATFLFFGVVLTARPDIGINKYLLALPEDQIAKCLKESNLEADKDKVLADVNSVDLEKLSCLVACTLRENNAIVNGEVKYDVVAELFTKVYTAKEDNLEQKLKNLKACIPAGANSKNDCEITQKVLECKWKMIEAVH